MQRIFPFSRTYNFRELGGYPTQDDRQIRWHKILRSGYLTELTSSELQQLKAYGLRYVVDLRSDYEQQSWPDPTPNFLTIYSLPLYPAEGNGALLYQALPPSDQYHDLGQIYQQAVLDRHSQKVFRQFFQILLANDQPNQSLVFHCAAGKDRTGILAILFLLLMKVPVNYIIQDYLLTNLMYQKDVDLRALDNPQDTTIQAMNFTRAEQTAVPAIQRAITDIYGSWTNFQQQILHLSTSDYQRLQDLYTIRPQN